MIAMRLHWLLPAALAACATGPADDRAVGGGGKADDPLDGIPSERRTVDHVPCPDDPDALIKVAFFDADSTVRVSKSGTVTAADDRDVNVLPFAAREIARLDDEGFVIAIISNQGGVGSGHTLFETAEGALAFTVSQLSRLGGKVHYFDFAENYDQFRKPKTGMATLLDEKLQDACGVGIDLSASFMVGDSGYKAGVDGPHPDGRPADDFSNSDRLFAENLGMPFHEPTDFFGWRDYDTFNIGSQADLEELLDAITARADELRANGGDPDQIDALEAEVEHNRDVNDL